LTVTGLVRHTDRHVINVIAKQSRVEYASLGFWQTGESLQSCDCFTSSFV